MPWFPTMRQMLLRMMHSSSASGEITLSRNAPWRWPSLQIRRTLPTWPKMLSSSSPHRLRKGCRDRGSLRVQRRSTALHVHSSEYALQPRWAPREARHVELLQAGRRRSRTRASSLEDADLVLARLQCHRGNSALGGMGCPAPPHAHDSAGNSVGQGATRLVVRDYHANKLARKR